MSLEIESTMDKTIGMWSDMVGKLCTASDSMSTLVLTFTLFSVFNLVCTLLLVEQVDGWNLSYFRCLETSCFFSHVSDCLIIAIVSTLIFPLAALASIRISVPKKWSEYHQDNLSESALCCDCFRCFYRIKENWLPQQNRKTKVLNGSVYDPLLNKSPKNSSPKSPKARSQSVIVQSSEWLDNQRALIDNGEVKSERNGTINNQQQMRTDTEHLNDRLSIEQRRNFWMSFLFVYGTLVQMYLGVKCISFDFKDEKYEGLLMASGKIYNLFYLSLSIINISDVTIPYFNN